MDGDDVDRPLCAAEHDSHSATNERHRVSRTGMFIYGSGAVPSAVKGDLLNSHLFYYYNQVLSYDCKLIFQVIFIFALLLS